MAIAPFTPGEPITDARLNQIVQAVNALMNASGSNGINVSADLAGLRIGLGVPVVKLQAFALKASLTAGGNVAARRQRNNGSDVYEDDTQFANETIYDKLYGTLTGASGDMALCFYDGDLDLWVIMGIECS